MAEIPELKEWIKNLKHPLVGEQTETILPLAKEALEAAYSEILKSMAPGFIERYEGR